ncbi:DUF6279 family lipoprotein [Vibrio navarrensis]
MLSRIYVRMTTSGRFILGLLGMLLPLTGCSNKMVYNHLDWVVLEYIDDYVTLTDEQEELVEERLDVLLQWHRESELPIYLSQLQLLSTLTETQLSKPFLVAQREALTQHRYRIAQKLAPDLYALALSLSQAQQDELLKNMAKAHRKRDEKYADLNEKEIRERYQEFFVEGAEEWLGELTPAQQALIKQWSQEVTITTADWRAYRAALRQAVEELFKHKQDPHYFQQHLTRLLLDPESYHGDAFKQKLQSNVDLADGYILQIARSMNAAQWRHFHREISDWQELASELHAQIVANR